MRVLAGELDYVLAVDLAEYLRHEDDLLPWLVAHLELRFLEDRLAGTEAAPWLQQQLESLLIKDLYLDAQFNVGGGQDSDARLLRELAVRWACDVGVQACHDYADLLYRQWSERNQ